MASEYPILMLPEPAEQVKGKRSGRGPTIHRPDIKTQGGRLKPKLDRLVKAMDQQRVKVQLSPDGLEPEYALVFEVAGSLHSFYGAVKKLEGLEWMFDFDDEDMQPDEFFYDEKHVENPFKGRVYCIMSDKKALSQVINLWNRYQREPDFKFDHGYGSLKDLFELLRDVRMWGPSDRFDETGIMEAWRYDVEFRNGSPSTFEAELFYRSDAQKRTFAANSVHEAIESMGGRVIAECVIDEIGYHGMKLELRSDKIEELLGDQRDNLSLATCNEVMFYRPNGQMAFDVVGDIVEEESVEQYVGSDTPGGQPVVALFDGLPLENHAVLRNRIDVDDPDGFGDNYPTSARVHSTAMASVIAHGDLSARPVSSIGRRLYVRPVMKPNSFGFETYPEDGLIVDLVHRAVKRLYDSDGSESAAAPSVRVINISLGNKAQQYLRTPSPLAKLLDWLSFRYEVLFIVSAGNQDIDKLPIDGGFEGLKSASVQERSAIFGEAVDREKRNLRLLSPAESLNPITVGATYEDCATLTETPIAVQPVENGKLNPITSIGGGINRSIKPEIVYPGGRFLVRDSDGTSISLIDNPSREPGVYAAAPSSSPVSRGYSYGVGTSYSAALVSHECALNYDVLEDVFADAGYPSIPDDYAALLLKAMAVHGATAESAMGIAEQQFGAGNKEIIRWAGFGKPNFSRVRECARNRVTTIGFGKIEKDKGQLFHVPLPLDFHSEVIERRLLVTLAYFSPAIYSRNEYRRAQLWFDRVGLTKERLVPKREYTDYRAIQRGTLQHQSFVGNGSFAWSEESDGIDILISCATTNHMESLRKQLVPYAILMTFETKADIDVYQPVAERLRPLVGVKPRNS